MNGLFFFIPDNYTGAAIAPYIPKLAQKLCPQIALPNWAELSSNWTTPPSPPSSHSLFFFLLSSLLPCLSLLPLLPSLNAFIFPLITSLIAHSPPSLPHRGFGPFYCFCKFVFYFLNCVVKLSHMMRSVTYLLRVSEPRAR